MITDDIPITSAIVTESGLDVRYVFGHVLLCFADMFESYLR